MADPAVFLDRDGTLIEEVDYPTRPEQIRILGGVTRGLARLAAAGYRLVVVTNQSAIARGLMTEDDLHRFHQALDEQLDLLGARLDAYYACPHLPDAELARRPDLAIDCDCRKPKPGLILGAAKDLDLDLGRSWLVGDAWRDIAAGQAAGLRTVKLPMSSDRDEPRPPDLAPPTAEAAGLDEAATVILNAPEIVPEFAEAAQPPVSAVETPPPAEDAAAGPAPSAMEEPAPAAAGEAAPAEAPAAEPGPAEPLAAEPAPAAEPPPVSEAAPPPPPAVKEEPVIAPSKIPAPPVALGTCARCGRDVFEADLVSGSAGERDGRLLCADCLARQARDAQEAIPADAAGLLRSILLELRRLNRTGRGGNFTLLRLFTYLIQAAALFCGLVLGPMSDDRAMYLQIAILLQLLVVSLLLIERRS